jgi:hypothetical protein
VRILKAVYHPNEAKGLGFTTQLYGAVTHRLEISFVSNKGQSAYSLFKTLYADWPIWTQMRFPDLATQDV